MGIDRSRRVTFEEVAETYDEAISGYPEELFDDVLTLSGIPSAGRILEIGCGPGNSTLPFARQGYRILAIELGEKLAELAAQNCRDYPGVEILNVAFEDWEVEELALSVDAFHWIPPEIGYPRVARALKDSGSAVFSWRVPVDPKTDWSRAIEAIYRERAPQAENPDTLFTFEWLVGIAKDNFGACECFGEVTVRHYSWSEAVTTERYLKRLRTFSSHREMDKGTREALFAGIRDVLDRSGGEVTMPRQVALFHARVCGSDSRRPL